MTDYAGDAVVGIDPASDLIVRRIPVGNGPIGVSVGEGSVWTANYLAGTVSRVDPKRGSAISIDVGRNATDVEAGEEGVWVTVDAG